MGLRKHMEIQGDGSMLSGCRTIIFLFFLLFAALGLGALYFYSAGDENARHLAEEGVTSLATITNKRVDTSHNTNRQASGMKRYYLEYSFPLADGGKAWQGDDQVSEEDYDSVEIGDQFDVRYWPGNPDIATILEGSFAAGAQLAKTIAIALLSLAGLLGLVLLFGFKRRG